VEKIVVKMEIMMMMLKTETTETTKTMMKRRRMRRTILSSSTKVTSRKAILRLPGETAVTKQMVAKSKLAQALYLPIQPHLVAISSLASRTDD